MECLNCRRLNCKVYSDTMFSKVKSAEGNMCAQVFVAEGFVRVYLLRTKADAGHALREFTEDVGAPGEIVVDKYKEQTQPGTEFV